MPATYPTSVKSFTPKQDRIDIVEAVDVDELQLEIAALETTLGTNPHLSLVYGSFATVAARLAASDTLLASLHGYFGTGGSVAESQVTNLVTDLATLTTGVTNSATDADLAGAVATLNAAITTEATARTTGDSTLTSALTTESSTRAAADTSLSSAVTAETSARVAAVSGEATTRLGVDNSLAARITVLETQFKSCETQYNNSVSRNYTSGGYQNLYLPAQGYLTNDYGTTVNGHGTVGFSGTQSRFYTDFPGVASLWAVTIVVTLQNNPTGVRGVRLVTAGGATLAEFIKAANDDVGDETISVSWIGRIGNSPSYFLYPQIMQNSGSTLVTRAHTSTTPTAMYFTRIPG